MTGPYELGGGYDCWKTSGPDEPVWGVCPDCGASQEDAEDQGGNDLWRCGCGRVFTDAEAVPADPRDDEPTLEGD